MNKTVSEIQNEIRRLERLDQEELLTALLDELDGGEPRLDPAWLDEIQRRSAEFDAGLVKSIPADEVFAHVRLRLEREG